VVKDELYLTACAFAACGRGRALEDAQFDVSLDSEVFVQWEDCGADGVGGDVAGDGGSCHAAFAVEDDVHVSFAEGRENAEWDQPPAHTPLSALCWYLVSDHAAAGS